MARHVAQRAEVPIRAVRPSRSSSSSMKALTLGARHSLLVDLSSEEQRGASGGGPGEVCIRARLVSELKKVGSIDPSNHTALLESVAKGVAFHHGGETLYRCPSGLEH